MPIYEYHCEDCANSFEALIRPGHDDDAACPQCHGLRISREMSVFAAARVGGDTGAPTPSSFSGGGGGCCGGGCH